MILNSKVIVNVIKMLLQLDVFLIEKKGMGNEEYIFTSE